MSEVTVKTEKVYSDSVGEVEKELAYVDKVEKRLDEDWLKLFKKEIEREKADIESDFAASYSRRSEMES